MIQMIKENKAALVTQIGQVKERINRVNRSDHKDARELHNLLTINSNQLEQLNRTLEKHEAALDKPYFGRIDYDDLNEHSYETLYIGKNGIARQQEILIVDWRAPAASVYYENEPGDGSYHVPGAETVNIRLHLKRTYDIADGTLRGYYDNDIASNDDLLISYLSQNKDAGMDTIIATIQKEQNQIIRQPPFKNMLIQGVAGSGKTTVITHHLSYILYNYSTYVQPEECCMIGGNEMLLSYISSGLPELDITHIHTKTMEHFLIELLDRNWKKKYRLTEPGDDCICKCRIGFIHALSDYIDNIRTRLLAPSTISDEQLGLLLSDANQAGTIQLNPHKSVAQLSALINRRVLSQIESLTGDDRELLKKKKKEYRNHWNPLADSPSIIELYSDFLVNYSREVKDLSQTVASVAENRFDLYDLAALVYIYRHITAAKDFDWYRQIIIDEVQDYGEALYFVLMDTLDRCHFTLTGDVSQNINCNTGLNDWAVMKDIFLKEKQDSFHLLLKSYRNTIEISKLAGCVLKKTTVRDYAIQPVIRHGKEVSWVTCSEAHVFKQCAALIHAALEKQFHTLAVICHNQEEADRVTGGLLQNGVLLSDGKDGFTNGPSVLPVALTKGLEFDVVILWEPVETNYPQNAGNANLLYVAVTRALHELYLLGSSEWSGILKD